VATIPKYIWFMWLQGLDNAPVVVRSCYRSWVMRNPGWQVVVIDSATLRDYVAVDYSSLTTPALPPTQLSDLIRLDLLANRGGVWVDATTFCVRPLDDWLPAKLQSGFFAFDRPRADKLISSWFLAAEPGNVLVTRLLEKMLTHWTRSPIRRDSRDLIVQILNRLLRGSPSTRRLWFTRPVRDWFGATPYHAIHYGFERLIVEDEESARTWSVTPRVSAGEPHLLWRSGFLSPISADVRSEIDHGQSPLYKLTWKLADEAVPHNSALAYLLGRADDLPQPVASGEPPEDAAKTAKARNTSES
jgi:hypothetical protein